MKKNSSRLIKILEASIIVLLLVSSLTTIALGTYENKIDSKILPPSEISKGNQYEGRLRIYVVEIESRWKMANKQPFHYALLDFAYDDDLSIRYLDTYENTISWSGDVEENNVIVMAATFNPEVHTNYADPPSGRPFEAYYVDAAAGATPGNTDSNTVDGDFTHTVFCEGGALSTCPACPYMADELLNVYESGDYPFYYVEMVVDKNSVASARMGDYNLYYVPSAFYDGGEEVVIGGGYGESHHRNIIESCGERDVHKLDFTLSVEWVGNGELEINISITNNEELPNAPPETPTITGLTEGKAETEYEYTFSTIDPDGDDVRYFIDWGDNTTSEWLGLYPSEQDATAKHTWNERGTYIIKIKAKDVYDLESDWTTLEVSMPKNKAINTPFYRFLENHPHLFPLLRQLLELQ